MANLCSFRRSRRAANAMQKKIPPTRLPHHTIGLPSRIRDDRWFVVAPFCQSRIGCFMIGHVYHGDEARCVTYSNVLLPRDIALWTSVRFPRRDIRAAGLNDRSPISVLRNLVDMMDWST